MTETATKRSRKTLFKPMVTVPAFTESIQTTFVIRCGCCPSPLETEEILNALEVKQSNIFEQTVIGVTDTILSRGGKKAMAALATMMKHFTSYKDASRIVLIIGQKCPKDVRKTDISKLGFSQKRIEEISSAEVTFRGWAPTFNSDVKVETYMFRNGRKGKLDFGLVS